MTEDGVEVTRPAIVDDLLVQPMFEELLYAEKDKDEAMRAKYGMTGKEARSKFGDTDGLKYDNITKVRSKKYDNITKVRSTTVRSKK